MISTTDDLRGIAQILSRPVRRPRARGPYGYERGVPRTGHPSRTGPWHDGVVGRPVRGPATQTAQPGPTTRQPLKGARKNTSRGDAVHSGFRLEAWPVMPWMGLQMREGVAWLQTRHRWSWA